MKIRDVICYTPPKNLTRFGETRSVVIEIITDSGIRGIGEGTLAFPMCLSNQVVAAVQGVREYLLGADTREIEKIWSDLYDQYFWRGGPVELHAQGAINHALWDILGKEHSLPVYQFFGGRMRDRLPVYHNGWWKGANTPQEVVQKALSIVETGATRLKWYPFEFLPQLQNNHQISKADIGRAVGEVLAVREAVGDKVDLMVDVWRRLDVASATQFCQGVEAAGLVFVEEAIPAENYDSMALLSKAVRVRLAAGERIISRYEFSKLFESRAIGIAQINVNRVGGISQAHKIAAMADNYDISVAPHNPTGALATSAAVHLCATLRNFALLERFVPFTDSWVSRNLVYGPDYVEVPNDPGLGIELDLSYLGKYMAPN